MVAYPQVAAERDRHAARRAMWRFFFLGLALSGLVVAALELMAGELIPLLFGDDFTEATTIAQILLLASLFMAGRRVLTDGVNGLGYPGYGTIAEVTSWILLLPGLAILLPWFGAEGVALALAVSWGASLLLLVALALVAGRPTGARRAKLAEASRRLAAFPRRLQAEHVFVVAAAALLSVLGGLAAVFFPTLAVVMLVALSAWLLFAFAWRALSERPRSLQPRVADHRDWLPGDQVLDDAAEEGFDVPRRSLRRGPAARPGHPQGVWAGHLFGSSLPRELPLRLRRARNSASQSTGEAAFPPLAGRGPFLARRPSLHIRVL